MGIFSLTTLIGFVVLFVFGIAIIIAVEYLYPKPPRSRDAIFLTWMGAGCIFVSLVVMFWFVWLVVAVGALLTGLMLVYRTSKA